MEQKTKVPASTPARENSERRSISLYPPDWAVIDEISDRFGVNVSSAVRMIVRTWDGFDGGSVDNSDSK